MSAEPSVLWMLSVSHMQDLPGSGVATRHTLVDPWSTQLLLPGGGQVVSLPSQVRLLCWTVHRLLSDDRAAGGPVRRGLTEDLFIESRSSCHMILMKTPFP